MPSWRLSKQRRESASTLTSTACAARLAEYYELTQIDQRTGLRSTTIAFMDKNRRKKQEHKLALAEASKEMEKPRMTESAREQSPMANDRLVVKHDADERTVDVHAAVVLDKA